MFGQIPTLENSGRKLLYWVILRGSGGSTGTYLHRPLSPRTIFPFFRQKSPNLQVPHVSGCFLVMVYCFKICQAVKSRILIL